MPTMTTLIETKRILSGSSDAVTRFFHNGCPYQIKQSIVLSYEKPGTRDHVPYAIAQIKSIRPESVAARKSNDKLAKMEGFTNATAWFNHFSTLYGASNYGHKECHRIQFNIIKLYDEALKDVR